LNEDFIPWITRYDESIISYFLYNNYHDTNTFQKAKAMGAYRMPVHELENNTIETTLELLEKFDLIGDTQYLDLVFERIENITGLPKITLTKNKRNGTPDKKKYPLSPDIIKTMARVIKKDEILYDYLLTHNKILITDDNIFSI
jgi:hypothetical protein